MVDLAGIADLRRAVAGDAPAVARVNVDSWRTTYREIVPAEHLAKLSYAEREAVWARVITDPRQVTFVAETQGKVIGFANGGRNRDEKSTFTSELYAVYLLQAHQQQGVGRRLTLAIAGELRKSGHGSMMVWVLRDNPACEFYRKLGGKLVATNLTIIGGASLAEVAYGWDDLGILLGPPRPR